MKFDIKKLYKSTIKTLEAHQTELSIALTALSLLAFVPESDDEKMEHDRLLALYQSQLSTVEHQLLILRSLVEGI